jgi:hypothetical protein
MIFNDCDFRFNIYLLKTEIMDKASTYIALGIIIMVILPFVINAMIKKMKLKKLQNRFTELANGQNLNISEFEVINRNYAIGIDHEAKKIAYLNSKIENTGIVVNLPEIRKCRMIIANRTEESNATNHIELAFSHTKNPESELKLELYNNPAFMPSADDIAIAEKWAEIANSGVE